MSEPLFDLQEHKSDSYGPRTYLNASFSDVTIAFAVNFNTAGEILTEKAAKGRIIQIPLVKGISSKQAARSIFSEMRKQGWRTVNIAGNGMYTLRPEGITQEHLNQAVYETLSYVHHYLGITRLRSGGQTGADLAGAVAGLVLGIPSIITYPKGYRQRTADGNDIIQSRDEAMDTIKRYAENIQVISHEQKTSDSKADH